MMTHSMLILDLHLLLPPTWTLSSLTSKPSTAMLPWVPKFKLRKMVTTLIILVKPGQPLGTTWMVPSWTSPLPAPPMPIPLSIFAKILKCGESLALLGLEHFVDLTVGKATRHQSMKNEAPLFQLLKLLLTKWVTILECFMTLMK